MATTLQYAKTQMQEGIWEKALLNIFVFVEYYVPKHLFDLDKAAPQQLALLKAVQDGKRYFVICAPRKSGKTILVAIVAVWLVLRDQKFRVFIVSGSQDQAEWLYTYCSAILWPSTAEGAEKRAWFEQFLKEEPRKSRIRMKEGGWLRYAPASKKQVNAPTADCLINDEFVLIPSVIVQQAWPMVRGSETPMRFLLSTATPGEENTDAFIDILEKSDEIGFEKFEWTDEDCPFLQTEQAQEDADIAEHFLTEDMHLTQYKGGLPRRAGRVFPRTFIRRAFIAPDPKKPGFLMDGTPYDPEKLEFRGESKGSFDWGFDHDTVMIEGYRGLDHKIVLMKMVVGSGTSAADWGQRAEDDTVDHNIEEWLCDSSGAFQNRELQDRGLKMTKRVFGHLYKGKEWMIGILYDWLQKALMVIPDTEEFEPLKKQFEKYRRDQDGKPKKGFDHCVDSLLCLASGWDPRYYNESEGYKQKSRPPREERLQSVEGEEWRKFSSGERPWMPDNWNEKKEELMRLPWEK